MNSVVFVVVVIASLSLAFVAKDKPKRISEQKCQEYAKHSTFNANEYQSFNCSLRYHELIRIDRIGFNAAEFRHLAKIYSESDTKKQMICNGALISEQYVLTTAQYVSDPNYLPEWVRLGDNDHPATQDFFITEITPHPRYTPPQTNHNLALLRLDRGVEFSPRYVLPACLHGAADDQELEAVFVAGWGTRNIDKNLDYDVDDQAAPADCGRALGELEDADAAKVFCTESVMCEWMQIKTGAPVQIERKDVGCMQDLLGINVQAEGFTCADKSNINLNIKIYEYLDWIEGIVWP